jgi:hypothetical protein
MKHRGRAEALQNRSELVAVTNVAADVRPRGLCLRRSNVYTQDLITARYQRLHQMGANETGASGYGNAHR